MKTKNLFLALCLGVTLILSSCGGDSKEAAGVDKAAAAQDSIEKANIAGYKAVMDAWMKGDKETLAKYCAADFIEHNPDTMISKKKGLEGMIEAMDLLKTVNSDMGYKIEHIAAEGDLVFVWGTMSGRWTGDMMGMKANGKSFDVNFSDVVRIKDGKMVEHWGLMDMPKMMSQLEMMGGH